MRHATWRLALGSRAKDIGFDVDDVMTLEEIPFYNEDLDCPPGPPAVENMKKLIAESDGVLIATPEYNHEIPSVLKNALDWASRPAFQSCFKNKPVSIISSSLAHHVLAESPVPCDTQSPARGRFTCGVRAQYELGEALIAMQAHLSWVLRWSSGAYTEKLTTANITTRAGCRSFCSLWKGCARKSSRALVVDIEQR
jgi:hypothetical protein